MAQVNQSELAIKKTSIQLDINEELVERVIQHKWKSLHWAQYANTTLEDSGLGTFKIRPRRLEMRITRFQNFLDKVIEQIQGGNLPDKKLERRKLLVTQVQEDIDYLKSKRNETKL